MLKKYGVSPSKVTWYVYVNGTDWKGDLKRLHLLRDHGQRAFLMRDRKIYKEKKYKCFVLQLYLCFQHIKCYK